MINELDLKGNELLVYALIHGFCQDGKSVFKGSLNYIMAWLNISKPTAIACIQSLIDKGMIVKSIIYNKNSVAGCEYYTKKSRNRNNLLSLFPLRNLIMHYFHFYKLLLSKFFYLHILLF